MGRSCRGMGEEVRGLKSINYKLQNSHGGVKYSIGNGEAKEHIGMTQGREQCCGDGLRDLEVLAGEAQKGKYQDNCNSIINKI